MPGFTPSRLTFARERRGLFLKEVADRCGLTAQAVSFWEAGSRTPSADNLQRLAEVLRFPVEFFGLDPIENIPHNAASFRARSRIAARDRDAALAAGRMAVDLARWIESRFSLPPVSIPLIEGADPSLAAEAVRQEWAIGLKPIPNIIHLLEAKGVLVFSLAQDCEQIDAFSFWLGERPIVLLNTRTSAERCMWDGAHELAHLVLHRQTTGRREEEEADQFAGEFLMPSQDVRDRVHSFLSLDQVTDAKRRWSVSAAALVYRLHSLELLSDWQYRAAYIELSKRGWRKTEPNPLPRFGSALLPKVFSALRERGATQRSIAAELGWRVKDLTDLIFGLGASFTAVEGSGQATDAERPTLRLLKPST